MKKLKQKFNDLNLRKKLIILLCVVGFIPVTLLTIYISVSLFRTVLDNKQADMKNSLELACASMENQLSICEQMMQYFVYDPNLIGFLESDSDQKTQRYGYYQEFRNSISALQYQNFAMQSVTIYSEAIDQSFGEETQPLEFLKEESWYRDDMVESQWYVDDTSDQLVSMYRIPGYSGLTSYAVVRTDMDTIFQSFSQLAAGSMGVTVYADAEIWSAAGEECVDEKGNVLSLRNAGDSCIQAEMEIEDPGIRVVCFQPKRSVQVISWNMIVGILIQICICLAIILLLGRRLADYISRPLEMLTEEIQNVDENRIETKINIERKDEVGILIRSYNHMIKRIQDLIQENYETRIAQKEFEMKALQAQINPHFLYNSLSIINWKAIEAGEEEISNITLALSSFYRTTLNKGNTMISIRMALENIKAYLQLQLWMHDNDFQVNYQLDGDTFDYMIPSLIFQPFVENSLEHGLDVKEDPDHQIWITVNQDDRVINVEIRDNGVGMDEETLEHILEYQAKGYGVKNVNDRMILHYGAEYGVRIRSCPGEGTAVLLTFPKNREERD